MNETATATATRLPALERRPHEATRAVVDVLGSEAPRALYRAFDAFNAEHFAGALGAPLLFILQTSSPRALGDYCGRDVHGLRSRVRISPAVLARGERFALDVLLHEMVHAWQSEVDGDTENGYRGHGPRFAAKCNVIGATMGLPPVGVKGRGGLPDCAQWPVCVRPAGYYPPEPPRRGKSAPAPRTRAPRGDAGTGRGASEPAAVRTALIAAIALAEDMSDEERRTTGFDAWLAAVREMLG